MIGGPARRKRELGIRDEERGVILLPRSRNEARHERLATVSRWPSVVENLRRLYGLSRDRALKAVSWLIGTSSPTDNEKFLSQYFGQP
jgi:hypothetical protein